MEYAKKNDPSLIWRFCGDGHPKRSNWFTLVRETGTETESHKRNKKLVERTISEYDAAAEHGTADPGTGKYGWDANWECSNSNEVYITLCGFSDATSMVCTVCKKERQFGDSESRSYWPKVTRCNESYEISSFPTVNKYYLEDEGWQCGTRVQDERGESTVFVSEYEQRSDEAYETKRGKGTATYISFCDFVQCAKCEKFRVLNRESTWYTMVSEILRQKGYDDNDDLYAKISGGLEIKSEWVCPEGTCYLAYVDNNLDEVIFFPDNGPVTKGNNVPCALCNAEATLSLSDLKLLLKHDLKYTCPLGNRTCEESKLRSGNIIDREAVEADDDESSGDLLTSEEAESLDYATSSDENIFYTRNIVPKQTKKGTHRSPRWPLSLRSTWSMESLNAATKLVKDFDELLEKDTFDAFCFWHKLHTVVENWMYEAYVELQRKEYTGSDETQKKELKMADETIRNWMYVPPSLLFTPKEEGKEEGEEEGEEEEEEEGEEEANATVGDVILTEATIRMIMMALSKSDAGYTVQLLGNMRRRSMVIVDAHLNIGSISVVELGDSIIRRDTEIKEKMRIKGDMHHKDAIDLFVDSMYEQEGRKRAKKALLEVSKEYNYEEDDEGQLSLSELKRYLLDLAWLCLDKEDQEEDETQEFEDLEEQDDEDDDEIEEIEEVEEVRLRREISRDLTTFVCGYIGGPIMDRLFEASAEKNSRSFSAVIRKIGAENEEELVEKYQRLIKAQMRLHLKARRGLSSLRNDVERAEDEVSQILAIGNLSSTLPVSSLDGSDESSGIAEVDESLRNLAAEESPDKTMLDTLIKRRGQLTEGDIKLKLASEIKLKLKREMQSAPDADINAKLREVMKEDENKAKLSELIQEEENRVRDIWKIDHGIQNIIKRRSREDEDKPKKGAYNRAEREEQLMLTKKAPVT